MTRQAAMTWGTTAVQGVAGVSSPWGLKYTPTSIGA